MEQLVGGGVGVAGGAAGYYSPEDPTAQKMFRSAVTNLGGPASLLANVGYVAGQALRRGDPTADVIYKAGAGAMQEAPLPGLDIPLGYWKALTHPGELRPERLPSGAVPSMFKMLQQLKYPGGLPPAPTRPKPRSRSRKG